MTTFPQASYEVYVATPTGERIALLDNMLTLDYVKALSNLGSFRVIVPTDKIPATAIAADSMIQIWRTTEGRPRALDFVGMVRSIDRFQQGGDDVVQLSGPDFVDLLTSRIVAYASGSAQASKSAAADDVMKAIVRENLGSLATDSDRDLSAFGLTVAADQSLAPSVALKFAKSVVLDALRDVADQASEAGTRVYFWLRPTVLNSTSIGFVFETGINYLGADRTYASGEPTVFSSEFGNLEAPQLTLDYSGESTFIYAGGEGEGEDREIATAQDTTRGAISPWARRERWTQAFNQTSSTALQDVADGALFRARPRLRFVGDLKDTPQTRYGVEWALGWRVSAVYQRYEFDGTIERVAVSINSMGDENITARLEADQ